MHLVSNYREALSKAWARHAEMLKAARQSGDPHDFEAASDAYLAALDLAAEANEVGELDL